MRRVGKTARKKRIVMARKKAKSKRVKRRKPSAIERDYIKSMKAWLATECLELEQIESLIEGQRTEIEFHRKHIRNHQAMLRLQQQKVARERRKFVKWKTKAGLV